MVGRTARNNRGFVNGCNQIGELAARSVQPLDDDGIDFATADCGEQFFVSEVAPFDQLQSLSMKMLSRQWPLPSMLLAIAPAFNLPEKNVRPFARRIVVSGNNGLPIASVCDRRIDFIGNLSPGRHSG